MTEVKMNAPMYLQVREAIRDAIDHGDYPPGTKIPSEAELAKHYGIHRLTVRNAISVLIKEGLLKSVQGKGVYVVGPKMKRDLETLGGFRQTMRQQGLEPSTRVLEKVVRPAGDKYGMIFQIRPEDDLIYIKRMDYADGDPVSLEEIYIPRAIVPNLMEMDLAVFSVFDIYDFYGVKLDHADQTLELTTLPHKDAKRLGLASEDAVLLFAATSYDDQNRVIEYARTYARGDKSNFLVHFSHEEKG
jgi:GntR family transcriptional regulator